MSAPNASFRLIVLVFIRLLLLKVPGAPSLGHAVLVTTYLGLNICFIFVYVDDSVMLLHAVVASRVGWYVCFKVLPIGFD